ncbi:MAG: DNA-3-methyladenine glycosylase [Thaumarchaeota archaeon]|nr:DNA-3-methyladenine glycosylase [Nitrososphaerota archaeon]
MQERVARSFFVGPTRQVAMKLLGTILVRQMGRLVLSGVIVEVEAYLGEIDPASHAYRGLTKRNAVMYGEPGHAYVYFTYGFHHCLNITTEKVGKAGAVLIRALQPREGIDRMKKNRGVNKLESLTDGPGKLTKALRIDRALNGEDLVASKKLYLVRGSGARINVGRSARIGIKVGLEHRWRYFIKGNPYISKTKPRSENP